MHEAASLADDVGFTVLPAALTPDEVRTLREGVESAVHRVVATTPPVEARVTAEGRRLQAVQGESLPETSVHWELDAEHPTVRNLRPVTHLDARLSALWSDARLTEPSAQVLGAREVSPLTSKLSLKRAGVGSEFVWHQDHSFLHAFLGSAAEQVVTAMVLLDDADRGNGALTVVPGSHRDGPRSHAHPLPDGDAEPLTIEAASGTVVLFSSLLVHRSDANRAERDRRALFYLYQPAGRPCLDEHQPDSGSDRQERRHGARPGDARSGVRQ